MLWTFIKLPIVVKFFVLPIFKGPFKTGFTVAINIPTPYKIYFQVGIKIKKKIPVCMLTIGKPPDVKW